MKAIITTINLVLILGLFSACKNSKKNAEVAKITSHSISSQDKNIIAFMELISDVVGSKGKYDVIVGGEKFSNLNDHPRKAVSPTNSFLTTSDAAGKYQIISQDFDKHKSSARVSDFSASSQDKIAREMLNASGASFWLKKITHSTYSFSMAINAARVMKSWEHRLPQSNPNYPSQGIKNLFKIFEYHRAKPNSESVNRPSSLPTNTSDIYGDLKGTGNDCSARGIFFCLETGGGKACYNSCNKEGKYFCETQRLNSCLASDGGDSGCHKNYCDGGGTGFFDADKAATLVGQSPSKLINIEYGGVGYDFYDPLKTGTLKTVLRLKELAKRVYRRTGFPIYIGDLSNKWGGNSGLHSGHWGGKEVDIAVMGNKPDNWVSYYYHAEYNRQASEVLIEELKAMGGVRYIYFNDPVLIKKYPGFVRRAYGHDDHYHIYWDAN